MLFLGYLRESLAWKGTRKVILSLYSERASPSPQKKEPRRVFAIRVPGLLARTVSYFLFSIGFQLEKTDPFDSTLV